MLQIVKADESDSSIKFRDKFGFPNLIGLSDVSLSILIHLDFPTNYRFRGGKSGSSSASKSVFCSISSSPAGL